MYAGRPWTIRQYAGFSTAEESNAFYRRNLAAGQKGLSVAFDLATHRGYDSDNPRVAGDVGMAGVAIDSVEDMKLLFDGIPLGEMSVSMTMNGAVLPVMAFFIVAGEEQGVPRAELTGTIQNDILKEFAVRNTYIYPPEPSMRIVSDIIAYCAAEMPKFNSISISGYHMHEAGATAVQELAYTLADGMEYVRAAQGRRARHRRIRGAAELLLGHRHEPVHGGRQAARRAHLVAPDHDRARRQEGRVQAAAHALPDERRQPDRAGRRTTTSSAPRSRRWRRCSAARSRCTPTASTRRSRCRPISRARIARNTQLILAEESGVTAVADPLGGSWYVEALTRELEEKAWALIEEVEAHGGMTKAVAEGLPKHRIEEAAAARAAKVDTGETVIVGVNRYRLAEEEEHDILEVDNARVRAGQIARIEKVRAGRDEAKVRAALDALTKPPKILPGTGRGTSETWWRGRSRAARRGPPPPLASAAVPRPVPGRN